MAKRKAEDRLMPGPTEPPKKTKKPSDAVPKTTAPSSGQQKTLVARFMEFTNSSEKATAERVLRQHGWNLNAAMNAFVPDQASSKNQNQYRAPLNKMFDKYRDKNLPDEINVEGASAILGEIEVDISDIGALVFFELVQSPSLGVITREGFVEKGLPEHKVDSLPKLRNVVLQRRSLLSTDTDVFKKVYNHTFVLALQEKSQKALPFEMAAEFWRMLFSSPGFDWRTSETNWLELWLEFYEAKVKRAVNKDLWKQTLNFALETVKDDSLSFWSEESSWPSVIDEFVEWVKERRSSDAMDTL